MVSCHLKQWSHHLAHAYVGIRRSHAAVTPSPYDGAIVIYFDFNATTPVDPRVLDAMMPLFSETFANASSVQHAPGQEVAELVEEARHAVAEAWAPKRGV